MPALADGQDSDSEDSDDNDEEIIFNVLRPDQQGTVTAGLLDDTVSMSSQSSTLNDTILQTVSLHQGHPSSPHPPSQTTLDMSGIPIPSNHLTYDTQDTIPIQDQDIPPPPPLPERRLRSQLQQT